jgi:deoxyribonuclease-4
LNLRSSEHEHIARGYIPEAGFCRILNHPKLRAKAFILETPVDDEGDELRNMETLKRLAGKTIRRSSAAIWRTVSEDGVS